MRILLAAAVAIFTTTAIAQTQSNPSATDQSLLMQANSYYDAGNYASAAEAYARVPESLRTRDVRLRQARSLSWSGQLDKAERAYAQLLKEQSTPDVELEYGNVQSWMGASKASVATLSDVFQRTPSEDAAIALANARAYSGDREGAVIFLNDYTNQHPDATKVRTLSDQLRASPELRIEQITHQIDAQPYNLALRVSRAQLAYDAGRYGEAMRDIQFAREHAPQKIDQLDDLEQKIARSRKAELEKLDQRRALLDQQAATAMSSSSTSNADELLSLAKSYTGLASYNQAIHLYDRYLTVRPDDLDARIQYARVLSWDRRWDASEKQYETILSKNPDRADLQLEYAQVLSYEGDFTPAVHTFRSLTDLRSNPRANLYPDVPQRAHYNIGQIYRWYGWNDHAVVEQNMALTTDPSYNDARTELDLLRHVHPATTLDAKYSYATDSDDFTMKRVDVEGAKWVSNRTQADLAVGRHQFEHFGDEVSANVVTGGVAYRYSDRWTGRAHAGLDFYDRGLGTRPFVGVGAEFLPNLQSRAALDFNHYDLVYDVFTLTSLGVPATTTTVNLHDPLSINDFRAHYDYNGGGLISWLGDASYGFISDDNNRAAAHGLVAFRVLRAPFLAFKVDGRYLRYDFRSNRYWSPPNYRSLAGVVQIGQNIRNRFLWNFEVKAGRAYESGFSSDLRSYEGNVTVPLNDTFDLVGNYGYGKSGRLQSFFAGNTSGDDFVNYWQRHWFVGVRVKQLFAHNDQHGGRNQYYYDTRALSGSPVIPPIGESH
jgi:tetratricopeptide (TPR) repeat protein